MGQQHMGEELGGQTTGLGQRETDERHRDESKRHGLEAELLQVQLSGFTPISPITGDRWRAIHGAFSLDPIRLTVWGNPRAKAWAREGSLGRAGKTCWAVLQKSGARQ